MPYLLGAKHSSDDNTSDQQGQTESVIPVATFKKGESAEIVKHNFSENTHLELVVIPIEHEPSFSVLIEQLKDQACCVFW